MDNRTLNYYMHDGPTAFRFVLAGNVSDEGARRLNQDWLTASSVIGDRKLIVDVTSLTGADKAGRALFASWHDKGAEFVAKTQASQVLVESILGKPAANPAAHKHIAEASRYTRIPLRTSLLLFAALVFPAQANSATLKPETVAAWNEYVQTANARHQERVRPGGSFLWILENSERGAKVHGGEIVAAPAGQNPKKVPGGLIHHWIGGVFLSGVNLDEILEVTRDYDRYKDYYRPSVVESKATARDGSTDQFSMLLMNRAFFLKTALDADYQASNVRVDDRRFYSVTKTTRMQEVEDFGQADQHRTPEGEGGGYIWKLFSITRFEQRDGGVYVELEAIALSRDIPVALRLVVDPIVRRVSRNSLLVSLEQTEQAVRGFATIARATGVPPRVEQLRVIPAFVSKNGTAVY